MSYRMLLQPSLDLQFLIWSGFWQTGTWERFVSQSVEEVCCGRFFHLRYSHGGCGMGAVLGIPGTGAQPHGQPESGHGTVILLLFCRILDPATGAAASWISSYISQLLLGYAAKKMLVLNDKQRFLLNVVHCYGFDLTLPLCLHYPRIQADDSPCLGHAIFTTDCKGDSGTTQRHLKLWFETGNASLPLTFHWSKQVMWPSFTLMRWSIKSL